MAEENVYDAVTIEDDTKIYDDVIALKKKMYPSQVAGK